MIEKPYFAIQSATIPDEFSALADDAVAGDEYGKVIGMIGSADRTYCFRTSDHGRFFEIVSSLSVGDLFERFPGFYLERSSMWSEWYSEMLPLSFEVLREFFSYFFYKSIFSCLRLLPESLLEDGESLRKFPVISEFEEVESVFIGDSEEITERRWDDSSRE